MAIINLKEALERDRMTSGAVYVNGVPQIRTGKKGEFMVGTFMHGRDSVEFKIWDSTTFLPVSVNGSGVYEAEVQGSEFNGQIYLTVKRIAPQLDPSIKAADFLPSVDRQDISEVWQEVKKDLLHLGLRQDGLQLLLKIINDPELGGRFMQEGAAMNRHDNQIGGLANHTFKMLRILVALIKNNPELQENVDLLTYGIMLHDIGKVYEYNNLELGEYWYAHHRIRGIEYLTKWKDEISDLYSEAFYRHIQAIISGHHGEYGDRPTTLSAGIIHYVDTIESQVTGLLEDWAKTNSAQLFVRDWGYLAGFPETTTNDHDSHNVYNDGEDR